MFIEVYQIPITNWNQPSVSSIDEKNRKLLAVHYIRDVCPSSKCKGRAEITMCDGGKITVVGSYTEIVERINVTYNL